MKNSHHGSDTIQHHIGPFLTWVAERRSERLTLLHTSRRKRKGLAPLALTSEEIDPYAADREIRRHWIRFWAPWRIGWWVGVLFMFGSALFAIGGAMGTWPDMTLIRSIDQSHIGWIFFVGSLFFTAAGYLQWLEVINGDLGATPSPGSAPHRWLFYGWRPRNLGYMAVGAQLIGTLLFNMNTADAMISGLDWMDQDMLVWAPNMLGSVCFLVASHASIMEVSHRYWTWQFHSLSWWITAVNMLGSIFFMVSAVCSFVEPGDTLAAPWLANFGTFAGAVCFFVGGYLLIPEQFEKKLSPPNARAETSQPGIRKLKPDFSHYRYVAFRQPGPRRRRNALSRARLLGLKPFRLNPFPS